MPFPNDYDERKKTDNWGYREIGGNDDADDEEDHGNDDADYEGDDDDNNDADYEDADSDDDNTDSETADYEGDDNYEEDADHEDDAAGYEEDTADYEGDTGSDERQHLCAICGERGIDSGESSMSVLCRECRQQKIKLSIPISIRLFLIVVCAVFLFSMVMFVTVISDYRDYVHAGRHMQAREYMFAFEKYRAILARYDFSVPLMLKTAEAAMGAQYTGYLAEVIDDYLVDKTLSEAEYRKGMEYVKFLNKYFDTYDEVDDIFNGVYEIFDPGEDLATVSLYIRVRLEELLLTENPDRTYIYFLLGNMAPDLETALKYYKLSVEQDPRWTYTYTFYGTALRRIGEFEQAKQVYLKALELNACDALSWRGLGVLQQLEGDKKQGLESIRYAHEIEPYGLYVPEALIIALIENGLRDEAMAYLDTIVYDGFQIEDDLRDYLDGVISIEQYYLS